MTRGTKVLHIIFATIHPQFIETYLQFGVFRRAIECGNLKVEIKDIRSFAVDRHGSVDGPPYGGGEGMIMRPEPLRSLIKSCPEGTRIITTSPAGRLWDHREAQRLSQSQDKPLLFICGRFGGIDQRFLDRYVDLDYSIGDYVMSGGELPVLAISDSMVRFLSGALGNASSASQDSFGSGMQGALEYPLYTRPPKWEGLEVPSVLISGNHRKIEQWQKQQALDKTRKLRPDLL